MKGKIIAIEGVDGSGKQTQSKLLIKALIDRGIGTIGRSFPNYESESSSLVKMYLRGDFGTDPMDIDAYIASSFFAVDRYASYMKDWKMNYEKGDIVILDRYTTANMVHQAGKIKDYKERDRFLDWVYNLEFGMYHLPKPDITIFLDIPMEVQRNLVKDRNNKIDGSKDIDIHERDINHLKDAREAGLYVSKKYSWTVINCVYEDNNMKSREKISEEILSSVMNILNR